MTPYPGAPSERVSIVNPTLKLCGKNLYTASQVYSTADNYSELAEDGKNCIRFTDGVEKKIAIPIITNQRYTVSFNGKLTEKVASGGTSNYFTFFYSDGTTSCYNNATKNTWAKRTLTSTAGKTVTHIGITATEYRNWVYIDKDSFQIELGTTASIYEPYKELQTVTFNGICI